MSLFDNALSKVKELDLELTFFNVEVKLALTSTWDFAKPISESTTKAMGCGHPNPSKQICSIFTSWSKCHSIGAGTMNLALVVLKVSFILPVINKKPSSVDIQAACQN